MKAKNFFIRFFSLVLAVVSVTASVTLLTSKNNVSAASDSTYVTPGEYRQESVAAPKVMINLYGNRYTNCTKVCSWKNDKSVEQIVSVVYEGNGAYRIYFKSYNDKCIDILRYNSRLKKGMKVELYDDNDDIAQLVIPYRVNDYTVIWRMKSNPSLAISLNGTKNGTQLVLKKFNPKDKNQQFVFRSADNSFQKVNAFTSDEPLTVSKALKSIPASYYKVSSIYTVSGKSYRFCITTKNYCGINQNTAFYQTASGKPVTDKSLYRKLETIMLLNTVRKEFLSNIKSTRENIILTYNCCAAFERNKQFTKLLGTAGGAGIRAVFECSTKTPAVALLNLTTTIPSSLIEPENTLGYIGIALLKPIAANTVFYCDSAISQLGTPFTDYAKAEKAIKTIANAKGHYNAAMAFGQPLLKKIASSNAWLTTGHDLTTALIQGLAGNKNIAVMEIYSAVGNVKSVADFYEVFNMHKAYDKAYANVMKTFRLN